MNREAWLAIVHRCHKESDTTVHTYYVLDMDAESENSRREELIS